MTKTDLVTIIIPYYHSDLTDIELISLRRAYEAFADFTIHILLPDDMPAGEYPPQRSNVIFKKIEGHYLSSVDAYNQLVLSKYFYEMFTEYEYILIYQLDAFAFDNRLEEFCKKGFDYIGAVWSLGVENYFHKDKYVYVGNGGFSLRRVSAFLNICEHFDTASIKISEDIFFASLSDQWLKIAPIEVANEFSVESYSEQILKNKRVIPFGCHALYKYSYGIYLSLIRKYGYNIENSLESTEWDSKYLSLPDKIPASLLDWIGRSSVAIWGAGRVGEAAFQILNHMGVEIAAFIDSNPNKKYYIGKKVFTPDNFFSENDYSIEKQSKVLICISDEKRGELLSDLEVLNIDSNTYRFLTLSV